MRKTRKLGPFFVPGTIALLSGYGTVTAQTSGTAVLLEEVIVTAQRREQSLQEVPISIETVTGVEIQRQGYRDLNELSNFSPSVYIDESDFLSQDRSIRGFGTFGNALTLEQAVPIFVDGIHFGRPAQVKLAFMDPARVEVLKGPQPVFFGMNATAGAFNIISAGPTPEWEGYLDIETGSFETSVINAAIGGPLSDTIGIRVAGKYEDGGGFIEDVVTGRKIGDYENLGARVILEFNPNDRLGITTKIEYSELERDSEVTVLCLTDGTLIYERGDDGTQARPGWQGNERSIWAPPPQGVGWAPGYRPLKTNCADDLGDTGISNGGPFVAPPDNVRDENMNFGAIDIRAAANEWMRRVGNVGRATDLDETLESTNGYVNVEYQLGNDIQLSWLTGFSTMDRINARDNGNTPFLMNIQDRSEDFTQYSSELRFTSGPGQIEWMAGVTWQDTDLDIVSNAPRANTRRGLRFNNAFEDQTWKTAFATVTFNFMDNRASIDIGGRFTDLDKTGGIAGLGAQWVFDVNPCDPRSAGGGSTPPGTGDNNPATCPLHPDAVQIAAADTTFLLPGANENNLWIIPWRDSRYTPSSWINGRAAAVGLQVLADREGDGPYGPGNGGDFSASEFDPQVTFRYRPNDDHSLFVRYAETFKAGGFDTGVSTLPDTIDDFRFEAESGWTIEVGSKGNLWDGRARYDVTLFSTTFQDFQVQSATGNQDDPFVAINAGEQRVQGVEFGLTGRVSDRLLLSFAGALMDGEFTFFPNAGCNEFERTNAPTGPCLTAAEAEALNGLDSSGDPIGEGTIDRSGTATPKTPDWKFVFGVDYEMPLSNGYMVTVNARGYASDGFITDTSGFSSVVKMDPHEDLNLTLGFGPQDGRWEVAVFGRNLLEAKLSYHPEFDVFDNGLAGEPGDGGVQFSRSNFATYGVKFRYSFD